MTGRKMGRQIQHRLAESLKKQRWKERTDSQMREGRTLPLFSSTGDSKTCQTKWHRSLSMRGREGWERERKVRLHGAKAQREKERNCRWECERQKRIIMIIMRGTDKRAVMCKPLGYQRVRAKSKPETWDCLRASPGQVLVHCVHFQ